MLATCRQQSALGAIGENPSDGPHDYCASMEHRTMRICHYTETALPKLGGQELVVDALVREQADLGHEVVVLTQWPRRKIRVDDASLPYQVVRHPRFWSTRRFVA